MILLHLIALVLAAAACIGIVYQIAAAALVRRFVRRAPPVPARRPPVSVLKPLAGDEAGLADHLQSLAHQDYPGLQIVCGTLDPKDPAQPVAAQVRDQFPKVDMVVVAGEGSAAKNRKIASLENLLAHARHGLLILADADVAAHPGYIDDLVAGLEEPGIGIVTALYVARPTDTPWSRLEASWINHAFLPSALVARAVGRRDGCFGATIALTRATLEKAGGLKPLRDLLADDWALGAAVRRLGLGIAVASRPVDMIVDHGSFASMAAHELRWARTIAALDRKGYAASILTQPVILALLGALAGGLDIGFLAVFAAAIAVRLIAVRVEERGLGLERASLGLLALREFLTFAVFVAAFSGRTVLWRGVRYRIRRDGTMQPLENSSS
jgi:ceramide glucosyltransferase